MNNSFKSRTQGWWLAATSPALCLLFSLQELWLRHPAYHFVPLPLAALLWFLFKDSRRLPIARAYPRASAWLATLHFLLALAAFVLVSPFIAGVAFGVAMLVYALACERSSYEDAPRWSFPALAIFFVPPPLMLDSDLHQMLAGLAARLSQGWLDAVNVLNVVEGTIVVTPEKRFFVDDACSGTNSMMVAICVAFIIGSLRRRSWQHAAIMSVTAGMISIASNVLRICVVIGGLHFWGLELDHGLQHEVLGMAFFALDLLVIWSADHGCHFVLHSASMANKPVNIQGTMPPGVSGFWPSRVSLAITLIGAVILLGPSILARNLPTSVTRLPAAVEDFNLPNNISGWARDAGAPLESSLIGDLGVRNQVWLFRKGEMEAYVALNYPFKGFHDTRLCYTGQGWQFVNQIDGALPGDTNNTVRFLQMSQPASLTQANLWLCVLDELGVPQKFASENPVERVTDRLLSRWTPSEPVTTTFVLQVLAVEPGSSNEVQSAFTELLSGARSWLANELSHRTL